MAANGENQRERMRERPRKGGKPMSKSFVNKALLGGAVAAGAAVWAIAPRTFSDKRRNYVPSIPDVWYAHRGLHDAGSGLTAQYANESGEYVALARRMAMKAGYGSPSVTGAIAPENSLAAFAAACEAGYGIELDLQMTADGEIVVVHDGDLMRVAGDPRRIADLTYDELTRIPLFPTDAPGAAVAAPLPGSLENPPLVTTPDSAPEGYFQHVPLFADVLKVVAGRVPLIVEYKFDDNSKWGSRDVELMEKGDALLQAYSGAYVIESFNPAAVNWYKENRPEVCRGQLSWWPQGEEKPSDPAALAKEYAAGALISTGFPALISSPTIGMAATVRRYGWLVSWVPFPCRGRCAAATSSPSAMTGSTIIFSRRSSPTSSRGFTYDFGLPPHDLRCGRPFLFDLLD